MKIKFFLLSMGMSMGLSSIAQIITPSQGDVYIGRPPHNTGIAIAPFTNHNAVVFDDLSNGPECHLYWMDELTGTILDSELQDGSDPDVAYTSHNEYLAMVYENGGQIYLNDYHLVVFSPVDYILNGTVAIAPGSYPNVDINSVGNGVVCWEDGGDIYGCTFTLNSGVCIPTMPVLLASGGTQPDIIVLDDDQTVALTFVNSVSGELMIELSDFWNLTGGSYAPMGGWSMPAMTFYGYPRIASQRNSDYGAVDNFAVVAQDYNGMGDEVHGYFFQGLWSVMGPVLINDQLEMCSSFDPRPVVAFERDKIDIAWSQEYSCSPLAMGFDNDILLAEFDGNGNNMNGPGVYFEVNQIQDTYNPAARPAISTKYDGTGYGTVSSNFSEGIVYNSVDALYWKSKNPSAPTFIEEPGNGTLVDIQTFSIGSNPVSETIEVISTNDAEATFVLYDNAGRLLEVEQVSTGDNTYSIDISHLSGGTYFLKCSSSADEEVLRVLQVR